MTEFLPGDLLMTGEHPDNVYLVVSLRDCNITKHKTGLVRMSFNKGWEITLCNLGHDASWTTKGLFEEGFSKIGRLDLSPLKEKSHGKKKR